MQESSVFTSLGINPVYLIGQIVNFVVLMLVLKKFLYKPILKKLDERAKLVSKGVKAAEDNIKLQEQMEVKRAEELKKAQKEVDKIIQKAKEDAKAVHAEIIAKSKVDAATWLKQEQTKFKASMATQEKALQQKMVDLSAEIAAKVLQQFLSDKKTQEETFKSQLRKIAGGVQ